VALAQKVEILQYIFTWLYFVLVLLMLLSIYMDSIFFVFLLCIFPSKCNILLKTFVSILFVLSFYIIFTIRADN
jgi:hypothetical protein